MMWNNCICLSTACRITQLFHFIFTEPGKVILEVPCTVLIIKICLHQLWGHFNFWETGLVNPTAELKQMHGRRKASIQMIPKLCTSTSKPGHELLQWHPLAHQPKPPTSKESSQALGLLYPLPVTRGDFRTLVPPPRRPYSSQGCPTCQVSR